MTDSLELVPVDVGEDLPPALLERRAALVAKVEDKARRARADSTRHAYARDWADFELWCAGVQVASLPASPLTVAAYASDCADPDDDREPLAVSTIERRLAAITAYHEAAGFPSPCIDAGVRTTLAGIRNELGVAPKARKKAVTTEDLRAASQAMGDRLIDLRDRAVLLVDYAGAFRRSELVGIDVEHIVDHPAGVEILLPRSKRDQQGKGRRVAIVYGEHAVTCPVRALRAWLAAAGITSGPAFRAVDRHGNVSSRRLSAQTVALIVKRHMTRLGKTAKEVKKYAGHSLRRGMATTASRNGARDRTIMATTGHASPNTLAPYVDEAKRFEDPASGYLDL